MKSLLTLSLVLVSTTLHAAVQTKTVEYKQGDTRLIGFLAWDDSIQGKAPGVLVIPEWWGLTDYPKERAKQLAKLGYVAFAADMYGEGKTTSDPAEAGKLAGVIKGDRALMRACARAGLDALKGQDNVDGSRLAAIGYCFGGTTVIELAMSGADVKGVVSFHGGLDFPNPGDIKNIKGSVLVCHGAADTFVPRPQLDAFVEAVNAGNIDCTIIEFSGAGDAFTNPKADTFGIKGIAYNQKADRRSWQAMQLLFKGIFK